MGYIIVEVGGSFRPRGSEAFSALDHGHADAVARAIEYLSGVVLPRAIALDHELHADGAEPRKSFTPERITA